jgi:hypothetical protein
LWPNQAKAMEHFIVRAIFQDFFAHLKNHMKPADRVKLCLVFQNHDQPQDIHISTADVEIIAIIRMKYEMKPGPHPRQIMDIEPDLYTVLGNKAYVDSQS